MPLECCHNVSYSLLYILCNCVSCQTLVYAVLEIDLSMQLVLETDLSAGVVPQTGGVQRVDVHVAFFTEQFTFLDHLHTAQEDPTFLRSRDHLNLQPQTPHMGTISISRRTQ